MATILVWSCWFILIPHAKAQANDLYKEHCAPCHGTDGSGSTTAGQKMKLGDLRSSRVQARSDDELFQTIAYGVKHKQYPHAFLKRGLTQEQITQIVGYLRKLAKSK